MRNDFIFVMDEGHLADLEELCPPQARHKIRLLLEGVPGCENSEVPDPYYGSYEGFVAVFELIARAVDHFLSHSDAFRR